MNKPKLILPIDTSMYLTNQEIKQFNKEIKKIYDSYPWYKKLYLKILSKLIKIKTKRGKQTQG
jgi:hypothetical protein